MTSKSMLISMVELNGIKEPLCVTCPNGPYTLGSVICRHYRDCECGYAEGLSPPRYPMPAKLSDWRNVSHRMAYNLKLAAYSPRDATNAFNYNNALFERNM